MQNTAYNAYFCYKTIYMVSFLFVCHPAAFDEQMMLNTLLALKANKTVQIPEYDFKNHCM